MSPRRLKRLSRPLAIAIQVAIVVVIAGAIGAVGFIEYSAQPNFCLNCHVMEPYYESWATSSHKDVKCIECHYAPGIKADASSATTRRASKRKRWASCRPPTRW
jgi:nitrate/TMAO reductase-like tetraheme cytochrome c subunit